MYNEYFGLTDRPFSIAPDPRYLYMSEQHKEALAHLMYGVKQDGGFILLTGEVGTGKTTVCRCFLKQLDDSIDVAYIVNPKQTSSELLESMCDDLGIPRVQDDQSIKSLTDVITNRLLENHAVGKSTVLLIDEAQNLSVEVLEQLRLLTNLETDQKKLLQIILLGQPELLDILAKPELRQLSQRVTARFHMGRLSRKDIIPYVQHRLAVAGCRMALFPQSTAKVIERASGGVPRLINLICDRALLGVYSSNGTTVTVQTLKQAAKEVLGEQKQSTCNKGTERFWVLGSALLVIQFLAVLLWLFKPWADDPIVMQRDSANSESTIALSESSEILRAHGVSDSLAVIQGSEANGIDNLFNANAFAMLGRPWGINALPNNKSQLCDDLSKTLLKCSGQNVSWKKLETINRPFVATAIVQGKSQYLFVDQLIEDEQGLKLRVVLESGDVELVNQALFVQLWTGQIDYLWLQPSQDIPLLKPGDAHSYVQKVRLLLTGEQGDLVYDQELSGLVRDFQSDMGVVSDGVIGPETIMLMNSVSGEVPVLKEQATNLRINMPSHIDQGAPLTEDDSVSQPESKSLNSNDLNVSLDSVEARG
ncbi:AAA family ATPase [Litoribrevibacter euphylliae]|uniref:AAA family ATPase n=1 Tax=Litoribrevibacter euphylliae TaxID=1834034 RepID=A0ABV7HCQ9_9GAMM